MKMSTCKPGSNQSGKQEWALYSWGHSTCLQVPPRWSTKETSKELPCSLKRVSKGQKPSETLASMAQLLHRVGFRHAWDIFPTATHSLVSIFHQAVFYPSRRATHPLFSSTSCRNLHETRQCSLAFAGSQARWPHPSPKMQSCWAACCSQAKREHRVYRHHKAALFYAHMFAARWLGNLNTPALWDGVLAFQTAN